MGSKALFTYLEEALVGVGLGYERAMRQHMFLFKPSSQDCVYIIRTQNNLPFSLCTCEEGDDSEHPKYVLQSFVFLNVPLV